MNKKNINNFKNFKKKYFSSKKKLTIGTWLQISSQEIAKIMSCSNYNWVAADLEHSFFSKADLPTIFDTILSNGTIPFARIKNSEAINIQEALDAGALGLIIPKIESEEQLKEAINYSKYPPGGSRGVAFCSANNFGLNFQEYIKDAMSPIIIAMIETIDGMNNLNEILRVKGLHGILVGPYDLSASLGITGKFNDKKFQSSIKKILRECKKRNIAVGIHQVQPNKNELKKLIRKGYNFLPYGIDTVFLQNTYPLK